MSHSQINWQKFHFLSKIGYVKLNSRIWPKHIMTVSSNAKVQSIREDIIKSLKHGYWSNRAILLLHLQNAN